MPRDTGIPYGQSVSGFAKSAGGGRVACKDFRIPAAIAGECCARQIGAAAVAAWQSARSSADQSPFALLEHSAHGGDEVLAIKRFPDYGGGTQRFRKG